MDIDNKIDHNQYGNRSGVSTTHYLLKLMDTLHMNADRPGCLSNVVITDFSKAFDLVDHNVIMRKFISMGVRPSVITWISNFLNRREQCVRYRGNFSEWKMLYLRVP